jgi:uncharacterized protein
MRLILITLAAVAALVAIVRTLEPRFTFFPTAGESMTPASAGISYEPIPITTRDGERLHAWLIPHDHARAQVLYFHGNGGNLSVWLPILAGIHRQGYTVAAIDYRGYGTSSGKPSERGLYRDVDAAVEWMGTVKEPGIPLVFWGRSLGTTMAAYASTRTAPHGLILESGFTNARAVIRGSKLLLALSVFSSYRLPTAEYARRAGCPVLVMHGDEDRVIPFTAGRALYDALPEPKRFEVIRGSDHNDAIAPDPQSYWEAVGDFITQLPR